MTREYVSGRAGESRTVFTGQSQLVEGNVYLGGRDLATYAAGTTYFDHADGLGTVRARSNLSGQVVEAYTSLPYGGWLNQVGTVSALHFTGKQFDGETSLTYFPARFQSGYTGRFLSPDPIGGSLANPQTLNKYAYVMNNPLRYTDPTGLYACADDAKGATEHCTSDADKKFEVSRQHDLQSKNADVRRAAAAYGDPGKEVVNARGDKVTVAFSSDVASNGEGGVTHSVLDANGATPISNSTVTFNPDDKGTALDADVGHEGSHVADAQDVAGSITYTSTSFHVGQDIRQYASEQRAYRVTDSIYRSANEPYNGCGTANCALGAGSSPLGTQGRIDAILRACPDIYHGPDGRPLTPRNPGGNVLNIVVPH